MPTIALMKSDIHRAVEGGSARIVAINLYWYTVLYVPPRGEVTYNSLHLPVLYWYTVLYLRILVPKCYSTIRECSAVSSEDSDRERLAAMAESL